MMQPAAREPDGDVAPFVVSTAAESSDVTTIAATGKNEGCIGYAGVGSDDPDNNNNNEKEVGDLMSKAFNVLVMVVR